MGESPLLYSGRDFCLFSPSQRLKELGPPHTGSDKVRSTALPTFDSTVFITTLHTGADVCRCGLPIRDKFYFVWATH